MGRYRRGRKHGKRWHRKRDGDGDAFSREDWALLENYLLEYRTKAYDAHTKRPESTSHQRENAPPADSPILIGGHNFAPITEKLVAQPYFDLPDTLTAKERRKIHSLCADLGLYHAGAGKKDDKARKKDGNRVNTNGDAATIVSGDCNGSADFPLKRRNAVSAFADGLQHVPDLEKLHESSSFPSRTCKPWYNHAHGSSTNNAIQKRIEAIEMEKLQIREMTAFPEKSLRESDCLDFAVLNSLDLSNVPSSEDTPWMLVDTVAKLKQCVDELSKISELAFDLEMCTVGEGNGKSVRTCLIQLASNVPVDINGKEAFKEYVIDPLQVWDAIPAHLGPLFSDPNVVKIGHGIGGMDTTSLHRDFGILILNAFDTFEASVILSQKKKGGLGLAHLCHHYSLPNWEQYSQLKHTYQNSDWKKRPLDSDALEYARCDVRCLVTLRKLLMRDLAKMAMLGGRRLMFGSSMEDDSDVNSALVDEMQSFDLQAEAENSAEPSFSESEFNGTASSNSLDGFNGAENTATAAKVSDITRTVINATELPAYEMLMKAISISQKKCLKLWTGDDEEPIMENQSLLSLIKRAAKQEGQWSAAQMRLYEQLAEWRGSVAQREYISASEVCSLDCLVYVAHRLPQDHWEMRRYSYALPPLLEDGSLPYCKELCKMVASSSCSILAESKSMRVLFYSEGNASQQNETVRVQRKLMKVLITTAAAGVIILAVKRMGRR
ncbi:hypothetical protein ACHAXT_000826 [Thalassiosira profunda]